MAKEKAKPTPATVKSDDNFSVKNSKGVSITVSKVFDKAPKAGQLAVGEVGQYTRSDGKVVYVVGNNNGGVSSAKTNIASAASTVDKVVRTAENRQIRDLGYENKVELDQLSRALTREVKAGNITEAEKKAALDAEKRANSSEVAAAKREVKSPGFQTLARDDTGLLGATTVTDISNGIVAPRTFNTKVIENPDGTKTSTINSLLYTGVGSDAARTDAAKYINLVDEFRYAHGLNQEYNYKDGSKSQSSQGIPSSKIYDAMMQGYIKVNPIEKTAADGTKYIDNDFVKGKGFSEDPALGKGFARQISDILGRGTEIGDKAFTRTVNGKTYITSPSGKDLMGNDQPLTFTGETDAAGNKIYSSVNNMDTKYNKASTLNVYVQNPDGSFTYMGTPSTAYTHIEKQKGGFSFGGFIKGVALSVGATLLGQTYLAPLIGQAFGLSTGVANAAAAALTGGALSAAQGGNVGDVLSSGALAAIGQGVGDIVAKAATSAGGYTALMDDIAKNGIGGYVAKAADDLYGAGASFADDIAKAATNTATTTPPFEGAVFNKETGTWLNPSYYDNVTTTTPGLISQGDMTLTGTQPSTTTAQLDDYLQQNVNNQVPVTPTPAPTPAPMVDNMSPPFEGAVYNQYTNNWLNPNYYDDVLSPNPILKTTGGATNPDTTPDGTPGGGLLGSLKNPLIAGGLGIIGGVAGKSILDSYLAPPVQEEATWSPFPQTTPQPGDTNMLGMPEWWMNLYGRQGVGAGNYLGYDVMRGLNIPSDVQSLLGISSGQNTGSSLIA